MTSPEGVVAMFGQSEVGLSGSVAQPQSLTVGSTSGADNEQ